MESIAIIALYVQADEHGVSDIEKCLRFVEKISHTEKQSASKRGSRNTMEQISQMVNKKEIIEAFTVRYREYFEKRMFEALISERNKGRR